MDVPQSDSFLNYESAINAVFMQVEKYNPLTGSRYWLSPTEIYEEKVQLVDKLRRQADLRTSLTILARMINYSCMIQPEVLIYKGKESLGLSRIADSNV